MDENNAALVLEDGTVAWGKGFGARSEREGEVVFNTSMGGYQESLTDPSYKHQIMLMTYPLIGNYGINDSDYESEKIHTEGLIIRELCNAPGHSKSKKSISNFLEEQGIPGIEGIDTRQLTRKIRAYGTMNGILKYPCTEQDLGALKERAKKLPNISDFDLVDLVSTKTIQRYESTGDKNVVLIDCGVKSSIISCLLERGINVIKVPAKTGIDEIMEFNPNGIMVSNGPGDPMQATQTIETLKKIINEEIPMFGICFGIQLISLACGATTYKLKFGHRGANQPVKDLDTGRVHITSQNHGFAVDPQSAKDAGLRVSHINLNDGSVEGVIHENLPLRAIQYHPEASPGPRYNYYLFDEFSEFLK